MGNYFTGIGKTLGKQAQTFAFALAHGGPMGGARAGQLVIKNTPLAPGVIKNTPGAPGVMKNYPWGLGGYQK